MSNPVDVSKLVPAFGAAPTDQSINILLDYLGAGDPTAHVASFPDGSFHNYYPNGLSLFYAKGGGSNDVLDRVDFYNPAPDGEAGSSRRRRKPTAYLASSDLIFRFPSTTVPIPPRPVPDPNLPHPKQRAGAVQPTSIERPESLVINAQTTAKTLVECFGEPVQKGGKVGWLETYMEWQVDVLDENGSSKKVGVLVELREGGGEGMTVWDQAGGWVWACLKVFLPLTEAS